MVARTATIGRGPLRLRLGVPESCWKSAEKERKSAGKVQEKCQEKCQELRKSGKKKKEQENVGKGGFAKRFQLFRWLIKYQISSYHGIHVVGRSAPESCSPLFSLFLPLKFSLFLDFSLTFPLIHLGKKHVTIEINQIIDDVMCCKVVIYYIIDLWLRTAPVLSSVVSYLGLCFLKGFLLSYFLWWRGMLRDYITFHSTFQSYLIWLKSLFFPFPRGHFLWWISAIIAAQ